mmetsp:Transcript_18832/g.29411  ORF Transcript_18832/g.29411 Transcript_18832/m.29411 type:complete len:222 (+) Transcript_18832:523-1188(+)|eukprot:CAMPEP_0184315656 /NCGR_PEP_ID=MMETSP1049-20130417/84266_1 /TAXON_ID=77928 /ORGANISM="Proteomonas sulcata, Strain CCMP704" /LENGTH=221 /DNA_ID=CAMNT_0026634277 /DNA_START=435 /DNA_END=1100 /DNA_ORIENTATION=-
MGSGISSEVRNYASVEEFMAWERSMREQGMQKTIEEDVRVQDQLTGLEDDNSRLLAEVQRIQRANLELEVKEDLLKKKVQCLKPEVEEKAKELEKTYKNLIQLTEKRKSFSSCTSPPVSTPDVRSPLGAKFPEGSMAAGEALQTRIAEMSSEVEEARELKQLEFYFEKLMALTKHEEKSVEELRRLLDLSEQQIDESTASDVSSNVDTRGIDISISKAQDL